MPVITALEVQQRNKERVNVFLDDEFAFGMTLMEAAKLHKGQRLTEAEIDLLKNDDEINQAVERAINFLSYRPRSSQEVRQNLMKKKLPETVIDETIERLQTLGYLDDTAFARFWIENRNSFKPSAPKALRYELRQKGIDDEMLNPLLDEIVDAEAAAYQASQKQISRLRGKTREEFQHKLGSFLQRRGFNYGVIRSVVNRHFEELGEQEPDYFAPTEGDTFGE